MKKILSILFLFISLASFSQDVFLDLVEVEQTSSYSYYKFEVTKTRQSTGYMQLSELNLYYNSSEINYSGSTATSPGSTYGAGESPDKAFDNDVNTKFAISNYSNPKSLIIQLTASAEIDSYSYSTANDVDGRDPVSWNLYGSNNGTNWILLDAKTDETITSSRKTETQIWNL